MARHGAGPPGLPASLRLTTAGASAVNRRQDPSRLDPRGQPRRVADRGVGQRVVGDLVEPGLVEAKRVERRPQANVRAEPADRGDRRLGGRGRVVGRRCNRECDRDQRQLAIADTAIEGEDLGQDDGEGKPVGSRPRVPIA